jgi:hypothetical protein
MVPKELTEQQSNKESKFAKTFWRCKMTWGRVITGDDIRGIDHYEFVPTGQTINQFSIWKY